MVRAARPAASVSVPIPWDELDHLAPDDWPSWPPERRPGGDPWAEMYDSPQSLEPLLELYERDLAAASGRAVAARVPEAAQRAAPGEPQPGQAPGVTA